jgi:hypothetical protein
VQRVWLYPILTASVAVAATAPVPIVGCGVNSTSPLPVAAVRCCRCAAIAPLLAVRAAGVGVRRPRNRYGDGLRLMSWMEGGTSQGSGDVSRSLSSESGDRFNDLQVWGLGLCYKLRRIPFNS